MLLLQEAGSAVRAGTRSDREVAVDGSRDHLVGNYVLRLSEVDAYDYETPPTFEQLSTQYVGVPEFDPFLAPLDGSAAQRRPLTEDQRLWAKNGYIVFEKMIPERIMDRYDQLRRDFGLRYEGWPNISPYDSFAEIRDLVLHPAMMSRIQELLGYRIAVHFNLSGYTSTDRGWHQDDYMCAETVMATGVAAWIALQDVALDMGPFEFVPGSHRWRWLRKNLVTRFLKPEVLRNETGQYEFWAHYAEKFVNPATDDYIRRMSGERRYFMAKRGDVLFWHGGLLHRGTPPDRPGIPRFSMIAHYLDPRRHYCGGVPAFHGNECYITFPQAAKLTMPAAMPA